MGNSNITLIVVLDLNGYYVMKWT